MADLHGIRRQLTYWRIRYGRNASLRALGIPIEKLAAETVDPEGTAEQGNARPGWLDLAADIVFVPTALAREALVGAIPFYTPPLIACSFSHYAIDS